MVISHEHKYLFIEIPLTASWAIRHELCEHYAGEPILHKHACYPEFRRVTSRKQKDYFVFATVRNPLDAAVSRFVKYKTDHKGAFSDPETVDRLRAEEADIEKFRFVQRADAGFEDYFDRFHRRPYNSMLELSRDHLDFVIRYENLQKGFSRVLQLIGIDQAGPIPMMNKTERKRRDWTSYYTAEIIDPSKRVFGPFMRRWGYEFPAHWGPYSPRWRDELAFRLLAVAQRFYLLNVRYSQAPCAKLLRWIRARLSS